MTTQNPPLRSNVPELSVSELSNAMKKTLEDGFGRVRVRGELSGLKIAASGHLYADLKDADSNLNVICWRGSVAKLGIRPEDGMDVVCTGKITTYPKSSRYQMIIETMELAGAGALLKMLEERKARLMAEGLFAAERKKQMPFLPDIIGVVTSPTGAVIRDILHRLQERFPRHVLLWPVNVQGDGAAEQIAAAIHGFSSMTKNRPDLIIVARGGGSLEDLMAFNDEAVVRAAANCTIPLISAVGHETDTTLIDYAADLRAPTPTAAAEMAVPVRRDLMARLLDDTGRLYNTTRRMVTLYEQRLGKTAAQLGDPRALLDLKTQTLDHLSHRLCGSFEKGVTRRAARIAEISGMLRHPRHILGEAARTITLWNTRLKGLRGRLLENPEQRLARADGLLDALSFHKVLERGFAVIRDQNNAPITSAEATNPESDITIQFHDGILKAQVK